MPALTELGWNDFFAQQLNAEKPDEFEPARVLAEHRTQYSVGAAGGELIAELAGRLRLELDAGGVTPAVGDWVLISVRTGEGRATIHRVLERRTKFERTAAGDVTYKQVIAANIDTAFVVTSLNNELNARRIERYLALVWESGATPVVVLNKADLCADPESERRAIERVAAGAEVLAMSALENQGVAPLEKYLQPGQTATLVGSSGVGKSTLLNRLLGAERMATRAISADGQRGSHTTTHRQLFVLPGGGMLIDTPGMRELQLTDSSEGLSQTFEDIEALMRSCRFADCQHETEPGCALKAALESGALDAARLESYLKLQREARYQAERHDLAAKSRQRDKWKRIHKAQKELYKQRDKR